MKNTIITLLLLVPSLVWGQMGHHQELSPEKRKEIEGMKVAYLTSQMDLSPEEAQVFWPVYNEFRKEMDAHRSEGRKMRQLHKTNQADYSEKELTEQMEYRFEHQRAAIDIEEKYFKKFKEILSPQKLMAMMEAEEGFKRELLKKVRGEKQGRRGDGK